MSTEKTVKSERIPTLWTAIHKSDVYSLQGRPLAAVLHDLSEAIVMHVDNPWQVSEGGPADPHGLPSSSLGSRGAGRLAGRRRSAGRTASRRSGAGWTAGRRRRAPGRPWGAPAPVHVKGRYYQDVCRPRQLI